MAGSPPRVACFQVILFEHGTERGPGGLTLDNATFPVQTLLTGRLEPTDQGLIKTYAGSADCGEFTPDLYVELSLLQSLG